LQNREHNIDTEALDTTGPLGARALGDVS